MAKNKKGKKAHNKVLQPEGSRWRFSATLLTKAIVGLATVAALATFYYQFILQPDIRLSLDFTGVKATGDGHVRATMHLVAHNRASKRADEFYWHLMVPEDKVVSVALNGATGTFNQKPSMTANGIKFQHIQGHVRQPLHRMMMEFATGEIVVREDSKTSWSNGAQS